MHGLEHWQTLTVRWLTNCIQVWRPGMWIYGNLWADITIVTHERISSLWSKNFQINVRRLHYLHWHAMHGICSTCRPHWHTLHIFMIKNTDWKDHQSRRRWTMMVPMASRGSSTLMNSPFRWRHSRLERQLDGMSPRPKDWAYRKITKPCRDWICTNYSVGWFSRSGSGHALGHQCWGRQHNLQNLIWHLAVLTDCTSTKNLPCRATIVQLVSTLSGSPSMRPFSHNSLKSIKIIKSFSASSRKRPGHASVDVECRQCPLIEVKSFAESIFLRRLW